MKSLEYLPVEFKAKNKDLSTGSYLLPHPMIAKYFLAVDVYDEPEQERISVTLVCLVSHNKRLFRNVTRYPNFEDCLMVRNVFFDENEQVIQYIKQNDEELARGHFFSNLIKRK